MNTSNEREGYRNRLDEGDIVYFVEGESIIGTGDLTVKKASVVQAEPDRRYPFVTLWDDVETDPNGLGVMVAKSPRELFTAKELGRIVGQCEGPLGIDYRPIDELLVDPQARHELTGLLGQRAISRLADDEMRRPRDPEY